MADNLLIVANSILGIYSIGLCLFGTIGNFFTLVICLSTNLKQTTTFVFLSFMTLTDVVSLYFWNLDHFLIPFFNLDRQNSSVLWCRLNTFIEFTALQSSAWLLVAISFDRYLTVRFKNWSSTYFKSSRAVITSIAIIVSLSLLNLNVLFTFGYRGKDENGTEITQCYSTPLDPSTRWMDVWGTVYSIFYTIIPFVLILFANLNLVIKIRRESNFMNKISTNQQKRQEKQKSLNKTVILITVLFIVLTLPGAIVTGLTGLLQQSDIGLIIVTLSDCITFSYHALNFAILFLTNKRFKRTIKSLFNKSPEAAANKPTTADGSNNYQETTTRSTL